MADEVVIDSDTFHERLASLITAWKQDKRNGDSIFQAATSLAIISGKSTDEQNIKSRAIQVSSLHIPWYLLIATDMPCIELAPGLRVPDHTLRFHDRLCVHPHNKEEGFATRRAQEW